MVECFNGQDIDSSKLPADRNGEKVSDEDVNVFSDVKNET